MTTENKLAPSILASNFLRLEEDLKMIDDSNAQWLHIDIMDGNFVPNISFGPDIVKSMKSACNKVFDVHLMIENPDLMIPKFVKAGADQITVHLEACPHLHRSIQLIKSFEGVKAGVAINPHSNITLLEDVLEDLDLILVMSVNPGFGGQQFIYQSLNKIKLLRERLIVRNLKADIVVDGGVGLHNAEAILSAGANVLVAGSSILKSDDPAGTIEKFMEILNASKWV